LIGYDIYIYVLTKLSLVNNVDSKIILKLHTFIIIVFILLITKLNTVFVFKLRYIYETFFQHLISVLFIFNHYIMYNILVTLNNKIVYRIAI